MTILAKNSRPTTAHQHTPPPSKKKKKFKKSKIAKSIFFRIHPRNVAQCTFPCAKHAAATKYFEILKNRDFGAVGAGKSLILLGFSVKSLGFSRFSFLRTRSRINCVIWTPIYWVFRVFWPQKPAQSMPEIGPNHWVFRSIPLIFRVFKSWEHPPE